MSTSPLPPSNPAELPTLPPAAADAPSTLSGLPDSAAAPGPGPEAAPGYEILGELGRGGMGIVNKARHTKLNRLVALKMILAGSHAGAADLTRFQTEAEAIARLRHANIVQVYEVGEHEGKPFFSLEFCGGGSLKEKLSGTPLPPREAAALVEALARAMQAAHGQHVIHRDLKPANVLLTEDGTPKVTDFGLAKKLDEAGQTHSGAVLGTPSYMAPEQAGGQTSDVGPLADVYALGAILYECLTGRPPFQGVTIAETLERVQNREPVAPSRLRRDVPRDLETICLHCLRKEPERRYASAQLLAEDLQRFRAGRPIAIRPVGNAERLWRWCRRNPRWASMIAAVTALLLGVTGVSLYAYVTVAEKNRKIEEKNEAIIKESGEKERQRFLAEKRLVETLDAVNLFAVDARVYCEDAIVPGESKKLLYEVLLQNLEKQVDESDAAFDEDRARQKAILYRQIAEVHLELGRLQKATEWYEKGLRVADQWVNESPGDPAAQSYRALYLQMMGNSYERDGRPDKTRAMHKEALEIRRKLLGNPEVDKLTPGKSYTDLCDSLDTFQLFEESLPLRERAYKQFGTFQLLDSWSWTHWKVATSSRGYSIKKLHLEKACELCAQLHEKRPTARVLLMRWAQMLRELGELEFYYGHFDEAQKHYAKLFEVNQKLALPDTVVGQRQMYNRAVYNLGVVERKLGRRAEARKHFELCLQLREELLRDYPNYSPVAHLQIDRLFALVALGDHSQAAKVADELGERNPVSAPIQYRLACVYSLSIPAVEEARGPMPLTPDDKALQARYCDKALKCLETFLASGIQNLADVDTDADLDPIRSDSRFAAILAKYKK
jgi:tetratricopeptide (TPR) repeat protein/tRNA A-37 threonylcarbamoyl transferase component Bud32